MKIIIYLIIVGAVSGLVDWMTYKKSPKNYTRSIYHFTIRTPLSMAGIGGLGMATLVGILVLCYFAGSSIDFQTDIFGRWIVGGMLLFCLVPVVATVPRVWDVVVDGDEITVINLFVFRRKYRISDITHCVKTTGSIRVYVKDKKKPHFL